MLDLIHSIFSFTIQAGEFILFTVFIKMIFAKWIAEKVLHWLQTKNHRNAAIWDHYNHGHPGEVTECALENCQIFQGAPLPQLA